MHFSCPCKPDQAVWPEASCSVRSHQACIRHKFCLSSQPRRMRRAPSLNILRSKVATEGKAGNKDTALSTDDKLRPQLSNSLQTKTEMQKSSFTVFGLQPSPELLSISMGKHGLAFAANAHPHWGSGVSVLLQCILCKEYLDWLVWPSPSSTRMSSI